MAAEPERETTELEEIQRLEKRLQDLGVQEEQQGAPPAEPSAKLSGGSWREQRLRELGLREEQLDAPPSQALLPEPERETTERMPAPLADADPGELMLGLPDDVLERIVLAVEGSLPQLSGTCRRFRKIVVRDDFDPLWLGQCAALLAEPERCFRALHSCGAARAAAADDGPVWRMIAMELRSGRVGGGGQAFAAHPASLCFGDQTEMQSYFALLSKLLADHPTSSDGAQQWHQWKHLPLRWRAADDPGGPVRWTSGSSKCRGLVEEWFAHDQSIKIELQ